MRRLTLIVLALCGSASVHAAHAQQVVLVDEVYTHSKDTTHDSHFYLDPPAVTPADWTSPINYVDGLIYVRLEVKTKPSAATTRFQVCFDSHPNYTCTLQAEPYTEVTAPDAITWTTSFPQLWSPGSANWKLGISGINLILKDTNNVKPSPEEVGDVISAMYMPTDLRVTVTLVAKDAIYVPPAAEMPDASVSDGGDDAAIDAGAALDASVASGPQDAAAGTSGGAGVIANAGSGAGVIANAGSGAGAAGAVGMQSGIDAAVGGPTTDSSNGSCSLARISAKQSVFPALALGLLLVGLGARARMRRRARRVLRSIAR